MIYENLGGSYFTALETYMDIKARKTKPSDPAGIAHWSARVLRERGDIEGAANLELFASMHEQLLTDHKGEYAVIVKGEYIGAVPDSDAGLELASGNNPDSGKVLIKKIVKTEPSSTHHSKVATKR